MTSHNKVTVGHQAYISEVRLESFDRKLCANCAFLQWVCLAGHMMYHSQLSRCACLTPRAVVFTSITMT